MTLVDITSLEAKANAVVAQSNELKAAITEEQQQRIALLSAVLTTVKPALPSLVGRIQTKSLTHNSGRGQDQVSYHERRGLRLDGCGSKAGPVCDDGDRGGNFEGWDVFILDDGSLLELHYEGDWSCYDTETNAWSLDEEEVVTQAADAAATYLVAEGHDKAALEAISTALDKQLDGKAKNRIKAALERAEKIKAILTLTSIV